MMGLTSTQKELLDFIQDRIARTGIAPSYEEMRDHLDVSSKSGIFRLLNALEDKGRIRRLHHRARSIEVIGFNPLTARKTNIVAAEALERIGAPVTAENVSLITAAFQSCLQARSQ